MKAKLTLLTLISLFCFKLNAQNNYNTDSFLLLPDKFFNGLNKKAVSLENKISRQTSKYISCLQKRELKLQRKLFQKDSVASKLLFDGIEEKYQNLLNPTNVLSKHSGMYLGHLDTLITSLDFLKNKIPGASSEMDKLISNYGTLYSKIQQTEKIKTFISDRQKLLKSELGRFGMFRELKKIKKQAYYYKEQVNEYLTILDNTTKLEEKLLDIVLSNPDFHNFFAKNSLFGSMFPLPGNSNSTAEDFASLQTRAVLDESFSKMFGVSSNHSQHIKKNIQSAEAQLNDMKNKIQNLSSGEFGTLSDNEQPEFKPNTQKTKSIFQRLEYGTDFQTQSAKYSFPITSDIGLSLGYKLNDKSVIGVGASYKLGFGTGWNNIEISHQGISLRSFIDWKIKGSFFVAGGYEQNYRSEIRSIELLNNYSAWQHSGLVGLSKKYKISKKIKGEFKLLWDFLSYQQIPQTQPILFRIGYSLK